ncbi:MAG: hypothetical protein AB7S39_21360 [Gemmatimonadales bacterium]
MPTKLGDGGAQLTIRPGLNPILGTGQGGDTAGRVGMVAVRVGKRAVAGDIEIVRPEMAVMRVDRAAVRADNGVELADIVTMRVDIGAEPADKGIERAGTGFVRSDIGVEPADIVVVHCRHRDRAQ